ncbi:hypothetical protein [Phaeovulum veldkampii]|uniref:Uncharacterized protein n=1 Tax=Phaeovulum veldkampii DSM 11550 TaxID=1185920 RepID=A0A2T4JJH8_9RHOB|nr:hypothetical protein [Phaeovulum veldkampii]PTE18070.1 hypothetical protein C5F46_05835 [Phaeovulum veldkampii DSM 11550]TDQ57128.1 hypothetical protein EV658_11490 [Phaeovulum veldkampii DSM 11550]
MKAQQAPERYSQGWIAGLDMRTALGRDMAARYLTVCDDLGGEASLSYAQRSLIERALWAEYWLASQERELAEGREFDAGRWTQASNALLGLWRTLGLERKAKDVTDLSSYLRRKAEAG